jgi:hypothetical protein
MPFIKAMNKENSEVFEANDGKKPKFPCSWKQRVGILKNPQSQTDFYQLHTAGPWERIEEGSKYHKICRPWPQLVWEEIKTEPTVLNSNLYIDWKGFSKN